MTPKEKAIELVDKFSFICSTCDYEDNAKQYALIAVDLRLEGDFIYSSIEYGGEDSLEYWIEVKKEIEKI